MPDHRARALRRLARRRRYASFLPGTLTWLKVLQPSPQRTPLHFSVLLVGVAAVGATVIASRPAVSPAVEVVNLSTADPTTAPQGTYSPEVEVPSAAATPPQVSPKVRTYVVESGDTLKALADRFGVTLATLVAANKLEDPDLIGAGQELIILPTSGVLHELNPGETLGQLATRYGIDARELARVNEVAAGTDEPLVGKQVVVPGIEPALPPARPREQAVAARQEAQPSNSGGADTSEPALASLTLTEDGEGAVAEAPKEETKQPVEKPRTALEYEVQPGDSIVSLAVQFGVSSQTILLANNLEDPDLITVGTKLKVLPVSGVEHEVDQGESLADIAAAYKVDMGPIIDFNGLADPDVIVVGDKLIIPGAVAKAVVAPPAVANQPAAPAAAPEPRASGSGGTAGAAPASQAAAAANRPAAPPVQPAIAVPAPAAGGGSGSAIMKNAMAYLGSRYVFGGSSPSGFDCSGFVWYVHKISGIEVSRGLWGQLNGGPRIARENLQPGDTVFFANTYMPGLSHVGIYIGGGQFVHAIDESRGVGVSNLGDAYWAGRYVGASRLR